MTMRVSLQPPPEETPISTCRTCNPGDAASVRFDKFVAEKIGELPKDLGNAGQAAAIRRRELHRKLIAKTGVGLYYGDRGSWVPPAKTAHPVRGSNCIDYSREVLGDAFRAAGKGDDWAAISAVLDKDPRGTTLARELQKRGWTTVYWNPDVYGPFDGNEQYAKNFEHAAQGYCAKAGGPTRVDDFVVNYAPNAAGSSITDAEAAAGKKAMARLERVPFYFGVAEGGIHTFVGGNGNVSELHWKADGTDPNAIEVTRLDRWFDYSPELQRNVGYSEGILMIPPGDWKAAATPPKSP